MPAPVLTAQLHSGLCSGVWSRLARRSPARCDTARLITSARPLCRRRFFRRTRQRNRAKTRAKTHRKVAQMGAKSPARAAGAGQAELCLCRGDDSGLSPARRRLCNRGAARGSGTHDAGDARGRSAGTGPVTQAALSSGAQGWRGKLPSVDERMSRGRRGAATTAI